MSLSESERQVLAELERDFGPPSAVARLCLLIQASRAAWGGLLIPAAAFVAGTSLLIAAILAGSIAGEVMVVAGIAAISYAAYAGGVAWPGPRRSQKQSTP